MSLFGKTAKQWKDENPDLSGNMRDYASINELICLSNMENINAVLINDGKLNKIAIQQMNVLNENNNRKFLK